MTDLENYQTLEMAGPKIVKSIQQSVSNRNKSYQKGSRYDKYKNPQKKAENSHLNHLKINLDDSTDGKDSDNIQGSRRGDVNITRNLNDDSYGVGTKRNYTQNPILSQRSNLEQNPGVDEIETPRSQPKLKLKIRKSKVLMEKPNLQGSSQPSFTVLDPNEISQQMMNGQVIREDSMSPKGLGERISTFDADAMEADTDLLLGEMMNPDTINHNTHLPVRNFEGTLASHILKENFQDTSLIGDQNFDLRDPEGQLDNEEFEKDDYDTSNMAIDEGSVGDRLVEKQKTYNLKKQLSEVQSKIQNRMKGKQSQLLMGSSYLQGSQKRTSLITRNDNINLEEIKGMAESIGRSDSPLRKINQNLVDYKIVYINIGSGNEQELRLSPKSFEFIPRDLLQFLGQWSKQFKNGVNEQNIINLELSQNNIQEIEGSLFMHLGKEGCQNIRSIRAQKNQIKYVSARIKDCVNLQTLKLSNNLLTGREFLPTEALNSPNFCASLEFLYLSNNDIRELPIQLNSLRNLKVLNLEHNKIRTLSYRQNNNDDDEDDKQPIVCSISGLESLEELYLGQNRLKDLPTVFHNFRKLRIIGLDWFSYISQPLTLPKIVEDQTVIQKLKNTCQYNKEEKKNQYITFRQFAKGFSDNGKYQIDGGQRIQEDGRTSLHLAVIKNDQAMVNNLLKDGADPNLLDNYQYSPLGLALTNNLINISKLILKFSQKINFKSAENSRLLLLSVEKLDIDLTEELLRQGCDPNLSQDVKTGENCLHLLVFKLSCANENVLIRAENTIQEEKFSRSEQKLKDQTPMVTDRDGKQEGHLKTHGDDTRYGIGLSDTKNNGFGDTSIYFNDHKKCLRILDSLLLHGMNVNQQCNQKYTPFLLAVRLGNVFLSQKLLQRLMDNSKVVNTLNNGGQVDPNRQIDLNLRGGYGLNTAYHLAATRTNFDILYELDKYGADIYSRNKDNKTAFQLVNNNLLMLKIVKKIEKKQVIQHHIQIIDKIQPPECKIVVHNNMYVNTCEYKQFDETLQKLKRESIKSPKDRRRTSLFSGQKRGSSQGGSITRQPIESQQSSKRSNAHKPQVKNNLKKLYLFDFLGENEKEYEKTVKNQQTREEMKQQLFRMDLSPKDSDRIKLSLQLNNGKIPQNMPKIKNMNLNEKKSSATIKLNNLNVKGLTRVDSSDIIETDRFAFGQGSSNKKSDTQKQQKVAHEREKKTQSKFSNWSQSEINLGDEQINLNLNNYNNYNDAIQKKGMSSKTSVEKLQPINLNASQRIDSMIPPPTPFGLKAQRMSMVYPNDDKSVSSKAMFNQNHKNIFFIKDQLFDKERIKQINNNLNSQICFCLNDPTYQEKMREREILLLNTEQDVNPSDRETKNLESTQVVLNSAEQTTTKKDDREILEYQVLSMFRDTINFGIQGNRQIQEFKLITQLKSIFNPKLKTHVNVLSEIIEKLYKMKQSKFIVVLILEMSAQCLQVIEFTKKNTNFKEGKLDQKNRHAQYGFITIRAALENLQQNINCPCWMQEEIQEVIATNQLPIRKPATTRNREDITLTEANDEPYNIFPNTSSKNANDSGGDESDALPSQHMMKYSKLNSSEKKNPNPVIAPSRTLHFNGPVKLIENSSRRVSALHYHDAPNTKIELKKNSVFGSKKNSHQANHSQQIIDLNNKIPTDQPFSSRKNSMIHHKNKNPLTQFPNSPDKKQQEQNETIQTELHELDSKISINVKQNGDKQSQITMAQIREKQKRINDVYKRFDDEFNTHMTIEHEEDFQVSNSSPVKMKLNQFDPEKTEMQHVGAMVNLSSFQKAKFNSNKNGARASHLAETELLVNHFEQQSILASMTDRSENGSSLIKEQKAFEKSYQDRDDKTGDAIIVKRQNINFKRAGTGAPDATSQPKLKIKIKNTDGSTSKASKKLPKNISSKKFNIQNIQSTQFIPSSKNSPREPNQDVHHRKNSRIDETTSGVSKFEEIKNSETTFKR